MTDLALEQPAPPTPEQERRVLLFKKHEGNSLHVGSAEAAFHVDGPQSAEVVLAGIDALLEQVTKGQ